MRDLQRWLTAAVCLCGWLSGAEPPGIWLDVPFVQQERNGCGAASIAMVMQYWQHHQGKSYGPSSDAERIQSVLYSSSAPGIYASDLESYLRQHSFRTFAFEGTWDDLKQHLEKGRPLVVALKLLTLRPGSSSGSLHYVVVTGLEPEQKLVLVNDPAERKLLKREQSSFEREWKGSGHWTLLAVPQTEATPSVP